jgi:putative ABC transport system ATP-binding protein
MGMNRIIETKDIHKIYHVGDVDVPALRGIDLVVESGEFVAIMGASGSGKSTLMNILGCLDQPTSGTYLLDGVNVDDLGKDEYADIRNQKIGFVFQVFNLLPRTSALENVELPLVYDRSRRIQDSRKAAMEALEKVGLADRLDHEPSQLSGGQQQRVAIARALVNRPALILADEPTGNLDSRTSVDVMTVFQDLNDQGITIVLVTHEDDIAIYARRIVRMRDGRIYEDAPVLDRHSAEADLVKMANRRRENGAVDMQRSLG